VCLCVFVCVCVCLCMFVYVCVGKNRIGKRWSNKKLKTCGQSNRKQSHEQIVSIAVSVLYGFSVVIDQMDNVFLKWIREILIPFGL